MSRAIVDELAIAIVKGGRLTHPSAVDVLPEGVADDRRFFLVAADGRQLDARRGPLTAVVSEWDGARRSLTMRFPDGVVVAGAVALGGRVDGLVSWDGNRAVAGREVVGGWSAALSEHLSEPVRLAERIERPAVDVAPLTLVSRASVERLEGVMGVEGLGARRFRMTLTVDGVGAHEEDAWEGRAIDVGSCRLRVGGAVPRCVAVTHDTVTGARDHGVLKGIVSYRPPGTDGVDAPFGRYAWVECPGRIAVGDDLGV